MEYHLNDIYGSQRIEFELPEETTYITISIESVYAGNKYEDTVISEIQIF